MGSCHAKKSLEPISFIETFREAENETNFCTFFIDNC